jgi:hypothetical protein
MIRTRCYGVVGAMIPSRMCCCPYVPCLPEGAERAVRP